MNINIKTEEESWILRRCAEEIKNYYESGVSSDVVTINSDKKTDLHYYLNYGFFEKKSPGIDVAFFTHLEREDHWLHNKFKEVASQVDYCTCTSWATHDILTDIGVDKDRIAVIKHGTDKQFKPRIRLGLVGRTYPSGRKGEFLVDNLLADEELNDKFEIVAWGEGWPVESEDIPFEELGDFYRSLDYVLVTSLIEGNPMCVQEGLASGVPVIGPPIGVLPEVPHIEYDTGDWESLKTVLLDIVDEDLIPRKKLAGNVHNWTWERWGAQHYKVFEMLKEEAYPKVSLIFPVYCANDDQKRYAEQTFGSLSVTDYPNYEVIVVDDQSPVNMDDVYDRFPEDYTIIRMGENVGSTEAVNMGAHIATGEYIQYQNIDVRFTRPDWLKQIMNCFRQFEDVGVVGSRTVYPNGETIQHGGMRFQDDGQNVHLERGAFIVTAGMDNRIVPMVHGCGLTMRRDFWQELGGFHKYEPHGWDDADICLRSWREGKKVVCCRQSWFEHIGSAVYGTPDDPRYYENRKIITDEFGDTLKMLQKKWQ